MKTGRMKLSEAIKKGAEIAPVHMQRNTVRPDNNGKLAACALGCAYLGLGDLPEHFFEYPYVDTSEAIRRVSTELGLSAEFLCKVISKNDRTLNPMSRQQIIKWLESIGE